MIKRTLSTSSMLLSQNAVTSITTKIRPFIATATATIATTTIKNLKNKMMSKKPAVLYHYPCPDGAFAALAAHLYFSSTSTPALFFPNTVYSPLRVIVLDHHKTALESLGMGISVNGNSNVIKVIDMERSGATIAYDYFKEKLLAEAGSNVDDDRRIKVAEFERVKKFFEYVEDADLWRWHLPNSKAFSSGLKDMNIEFDSRVNPELFQQLLLLDPEFIISQGTLSLAEKHKLIHDAVEQSYEIALGGGAFGYCLAVNADSSIELRSELGHQLANKSRRKNLRGIGAIVYKVPELENDRLLKISLRSIENEDTTEISQKFGGGGHRNASSFMLSSAEFEKWRVLGVV